MSSSINHDNFATQDEEMHQKIIDGLCTIQDACSGSGPWDAGHYGVTNFYEPYEKALKLFIEAQDGTFYPFDSGFLSFKKVLYTVRFSRAVEDGPLKVEVVCEDDFHTQSESYLMPVKRVNFENAVKEAEYLISEAEKGLQQRYEALNAAM